jgi:hypothetical protein
VVFKSSFESVEKISTRGHAKDNAEHFDGQIITHHLQERRNKSAKL